MHREPLALLAALLALCLAAPASADARTKRIKPRMNVYGFSDHQVQTGNIPPGGTLLSCGAGDTLLAYISFRGLHNGKKAKLIWMLNGQTYFDYSAPWTLGGRGYGWIGVPKRDADPKLPSGSYQMNFFYARRLLVRASVNLNTDC